MILALHVALWRFGNTGLLRVVSSFGEKMLHQSLNVAKREWWSGDMDEVRLLRRILFTELRVSKCRFR